MHNDALQAVMLSWADSSPSAAAAYVQTLPQGDTRNTATAQIAVAVNSVTGGTLPRTRTRLLC